MVVTGIEVLLWRIGVLQRLDLLCIGTAGQHAGDRTAQQHAARHAQRRLRCTRQKTTTLPAPVLNIRLAVPWPAWPCRAPRRLVIPERASQEPSGGTLPGLELLDPLLRLPQRPFLDQYGLRHVVGRRRVFPQPLLDQRLCVPITRRAVARHILDTVEQAVNGLLVLLVRHLSTPQAHSTT